MHNQNETQQHGESRHVERTFLYTYVPNSDAEIFMYSAGRCFYCTHVQLVRETTIRKFFETCHTIRHYVLTLFYISRYISKWLCYNLTSFSSTKSTNIGLFCMVDWNTLLREMLSLIVWMHFIAFKVLCDCSKLTVDCTLSPPDRFHLT